ncbi:AfsR/SARP family transcriptional regulator [Streptomyces acidiscabies]|uniref:Tetratricopeptide repeat protein n=1 Tax=Streptomyces acidiscabies TaxID=42234 RepID=A0AAP6BL68_9ACTN|nr:tetratricopeptide repeat protein [Streptomyces acidiscabies]MDX2966839.1 tetratricopeptide repeat protein [Streptomyces acidiscabies]MDX3025857.1 tetratricopeptide repeat protein [Streptomyces acidiscabies]MDX3796794.1 tetratricopeptide repeat protein [Streptomyces acidiscabies]
MEFRVLGPVVVMEAGVMVEVRSAKARELLAVLLLAPGHRASHSHITRCLWPGEESNSNRIRQIFHQLRRSVPGVVVDRNEPGYGQICVAPQSVDCVRFLERKRAAENTVNPAERLASLRAALAEYRGTPLEDMPGTGFERERAALMTELREATAACVQAELECGETHSALDRVTSALTSWPDNENLLRLNIAALQALGKEDEIEELLACWRRQSGRPTFHLLLADGTEETRRGGTDMKATLPAKLRQLPVRPAVFVGRQSQLHQLSRAVLGQTAGCSRIAVVSGMPGVGKTGLAVEAGARLEQHFQDILYVDLGGFSGGEPEHSGAILARFLNDLGARSKTPTMDGLVSAYRSKLAERTVLVILDNARDEHHVRPLLPGDAGMSAAIVTSRLRMDGLLIKERACLVDLTPLEIPAAAELLRRQVGEDRMRTVVPFIDDLVGYCGGLPFMLALVAARIVLRPAQALGSIVRELRDDSTRSNFLDLGPKDLSIRLQLDASYGLLSTQAARLLWQLAVHPGPTVSWTALRAFEPTSGFVVRAVDDLVRMSLVTEEPTGERYSLHDLVRVYVTEKAEQQDDEERELLIDRVLSFLLHNAWACDRKLDSGRRLPIGEADGIDVVAPSDSAEAMKWFDTEYSTLTAALRLSKKHGRDRYTWLLAMAMVTFQWRSGRHLDALRYLTFSLPAVEREGGPADIAMVLRMLAGTHRSLGDSTQAARELRRAVSLSEGCDDLAGISMGGYLLGVLLREGGAPGEALEHFTASLAAFEQLGDVLGRGVALSGIGNSLYDLGKYEEGLNYCLSSLNVLERTEDVNGQAYALFSLGRIRVARRDYGEAITDLERALVLYRFLSYGSRAARTLVWLSEALQDAGRMAEAMDAIEQTRSELEKLGESDLDAAMERLRNLP